MSRRSQTRNQYESTLTGELPAGGFAATVVSALGFEIDEPIYLVIEPDVPGQREWVRVVSITGNTFNIDPNPNDHGSTGRNLEGSDGDLTHPSGSIVRSVSTEQIYLDIFQDAEDDELNLAQHETDGGDPHASAGYLTETDADGIYVQLAGSQLNSTAHIGDDTTPSLADHLTRKGYVDDQDTAAIAAAASYSDGLDHDHATPIGDHAAIADAHHVKTVQTFLHEDLSDVSASQHHVKTPDQTFLHADLSDVSTSQHHVRFSDGDARTAVDDGTYVKLTPAGDQTITAGNLILGGGGYINAYDATPPGGGDINNFQLRNIIARDTPPLVGDGKDGDVFIHYSFSAATAGADVYVKVSGTWRGQA